jgi:hypothetical protein
MNRVQKLTEAAEIPVGYTIAGASLSTPIWIDFLTPYIQFGTLLTGFVIGCLTVYLQIRKIRRDK